MRNKTKKIIAKSLSNQQGISKISAMKAYNVSNSNSVELKLKLIAIEKYLRKEKAQIIP